jgi:hypothetical protein
MRNTLAEATHEQMEAFLAPFIARLGGWQESTPDNSHVCAFHRILDGSCVVCGSVDEAINAANTDPPQEPAQAACGTTHYAGCACHERGWKKKWQATVEMAAQAQVERDIARELCRWAFPRLRAHSADGASGTYDAAGEKMMEHPEIFSENVQDN